MTYRAINYELENDPGVSVEIFIDPESRRDGVVFFVLEQGAERITVNLTCLEDLLACANGLLKEWREVQAERINGIWCVDDDKHGPYGLRGYIDKGPTAPTHWLPLPAAAGSEQKEGANGYVLVPEKATPLIREALRIGMRREVPNDELCDIRWRAAIAAAQDSETEAGNG